MKETSCPSRRVPLSSSCLYTAALSSPEATQTVFSNFTEGSHTTQGRTAEKEAICNEEWRKIQPETAHSGLEPTLSRMTK